MLNKRRIIPITRPASFPNVKLIGIVCGESTLAGSFSFLFFTIGRWIGKGNGGADGVERERVVGWRNQRWSNKSPGFRFVCECVFFLIYLFFFICFKCNKKKKDNFIPLYFTMQRLPTFFLEKWINKKQISSANVDAYVFRFCFRIFPSFFPSFLISTTEIKIINKRIFKCSASPTVAV